MCNLNEKSRIELGERLLKMKLSVDDRKFITYLLSKKRSISISDINTDKVTDADLSNYKSFNKKK
jgi:hypothetical protein